MTFPYIYHIYALIDPRTFKPFYVGLSVDPKQRLRNHIRSIYHNRKQTASGKYIKKLADDGLIPQMMIIETISIQTPRPDFFIAFRRERYWINRFKELGHSLTNDRSELDFAY